MKRYIKDVFIIILIMLYVLCIINFKSYAVVDDSLYSLQYNYDNDKNYVGEYYVPIGSSFDVFNSLYLKGENGNEDIVNLDINNLNVSSCGNIEVKKGQNSITYNALKEGVDAIHCEYEYNGETYATDIQLNVCNMEDTFSNGHTAFIFADESTLKVGSNTGVTVDLCAFNNKEVNIDDYDSYYSVEWSSSNNSIVNVASQSQTRVNQGSDNCVNYRITANIEGISTGEAEVYCKIKTSDNEEITKNVKVKIQGEGSSTPQAYQLIDNTPIIVGPNMYIKEIGKSIVLPISLIDSNGEKQNLNTDNMTVTISDKNIGTLESKKLNDENFQEMIIEINTLSEGTITIDMEYLNELDNKKYKLSETFTIYNPDDKFEITYQWAVINKSVLTMKPNDIQEVSADVISLGTYAVEYPEGYDNSNYYIYEWSSANEDIAKVESGEDNKNVKITAITTGNTEVYCTIKTADGSETIKKTIKVTVTGDSESKDDENSDSRSEEDSENKKDDTVSPNKLANTGEKFTFIVAILFFIIVAVISKKKFKNK